IAPVDEATALEMLGSLRGAPLLHRARGRPAMDLPGVARFVAAFSDLAARHPEIAEFEVNPVLATPDGAIGLDARIVLGPQATPSQRGEADEVKPGRQAGAG